MDVTWIEIGIWVWWLFVGVVGLLALGLIIVNLRMLCAPDSHRHDHQA